jgi:hypothetical protein
VPEELFEQADDPADVAAAAARAVHDGREHRRQQRELLRVEAARPRPRPTPAARARRRPDAPPTAATERRRAAHGVLRIAGRQMLRHRHRGLMHRFLSLRAGGVQRE